MAQWGLNGVHGMILFVPTSLTSVMKGLLYHFLKKVASIVFISSPLKFPLFLFVLKKRHASVAASQAAQKHTAYMLECLLEYARKFVFELFLQEWRSRYHDQTGCIT